MITGKGSRLLPVGDGEEGQHSNDMVIVRAPSSEQCWVVGRRAHSSLAFVHWPLTTHSSRDGARAQGEGGLHHGRTALE